MQTEEVINRAARMALIKGVIALGPHQQSIVVVGGHAVALRTADVPLQVASYTTDGDVAIDPSSLSESPRLDELLEPAGFHKTREVGQWSCQIQVDGEAFEIPLDLMVPEAVAPGSGRRSVELEGQDPLHARRSSGLEACLVDNDYLVLQTLEPGDTEMVTVRVAGAGGLLIAKAYKISDRARNPDRLSDKDAADVYRLLLIDRADTATRLNRALANPQTSPVTTRGLELLDGLFRRPDSVGTVMAQRALAGAAEPATVAAVISGAVAELRSKINQ
jgi:hypothetical protein